MTAHTVPPTPDGSSTQAGGTSGERTVYRIITPVYQDVESFQVLRRNILATLAPSGGTTPGVTFYVVDDSGGRDPEIDKLRNLSDVVIITPPFNLGHQRALVAGLRVVSADFAADDVIVTMDSDGEDQPEDIPRLVDALLASSDPCSVAVARRTRRHASLSFRTLYLGFILVFRVLTGRVIRSGNFAAFRGSYATTMLPHPSFDLCYSSSLIALDPEPLYVPCARGKRYAGQSRMGPLNLLMHGVRMMMPLADRIAIRALALSGILAMTTLLALVVIGLLRATGAVDSLAFGGAFVLTGVIGAALSLLTFLVLFTGFVQTSGISMARIHEQVRIDA
jgi:hypothetical protein